MFLVSLLATSDSQALMACAKSLSWYCHNSNSTVPPIGFETTSHGSTPGLHCWCLSSIGWSYLGETGNGNNGIIACPTVCKSSCGF
jgi:hypothetical protein